ncbi:MAG TPA: PIN domain-containing protein [Longimicrobium sp.]|nr:PIN domain-containing protein [Longimicrobium sp.]
MDVLFLDANVLFSAAYHAGSRIRQLWELDGTQLVTSGYALEEARRNLSGVDQRRTLEALASGMRVVHESGAWALPQDVILPEKDRPILSAAIVSGATHLITGDQTHFGPWYGKQAGGVLILRPATYLPSRVQPDAAGFAGEEKSPHAESAE